ncbi:paraquat-inducible protein A [Uliginosibacterium sediminicola]|uniref:Paraquat-inducible protein A n=1 Tax=Uliginosibacterium sediminicola TaxID=2024550 RepID=A0ABU9Z2M8_9RHOO
MTTALRAGLCGCHACGLVSTLAEHSHCPRCGARLHARKPDSLVRCWALLLAACVLYVPANLLPIMETTSFGASERNTILSGVVALWTGGSQDLALIVFIASVVVPIGKLLSLVVLLLGVQFRSGRNLLQRARLYRLVELVGKWSMLDVYVVALLAALVRFDALMDVRAGTGALAFGAVVVLTMLAAQAFDPRLIWDASNE